jgi:glycerophosphoryl diester phosphodiesterase
VCIVAHRGASSLEMENTMPAFEAAVRAGADAIELDIQLTFDGVPVIYHDRTLGKLTSGRRRIGDLSLGQLRELDFARRRGPRYRGVTVPTLDEVLDAFGRRLPLLLEIKTDAERSKSTRWRRLVESVVESVASRRLEARVYVLSFDAAALAMVGRISPRIRRVRNVDVGPRWSSRMQRSLADVHALCLPARFATARLGRSLLEHQCRLWVYRCDTERALARARRSGAEAFITDDPAWLRRRLEH